MSQHLEKLLLSKRVLLLQGPMGNFFSRLAGWLSKHEVDYLKLNFNGGDRFFSKHIKNCFNYTDTLENFSVWLEVFIDQQGIDTIVCFGDCRLYHRIAKEISVKKGLRFFAFEEGYIRPNFITFEQDGVNFYSNFGKKFNKNNSNIQQNINKPVEVVNNSFFLMIYSAVLYYLFWATFQSQYPNYRHHRDIAPHAELYFWCISGFRRLKNYIFEDRRFQKLLRLNSKKYFIFALQVHNDSQIQTHSDLKSVELYIKKVIENFGTYASKDQHLVIKHHPMDRGYRNYSKLIEKCAIKNNVKGRLHYFCDIHFPSLLKHSLGMVTVNSTTGLQALFHHIPVKVLGHAIYNLPRLTNQYLLKYFWSKPGEVDTIYFNYFKNELINHSQLNGAFYGKSPWMDESRNMIQTKVKPVKKIALDKSKQY